MKYVLFIVMCLVIGCGDERICSDWSGTLGGTQVEGNHAWMVSDVLTMEALSGPDAQHTGLRLTATFVEGLGVDVPVQVVGSDLNVTYASVDEQSVRFVGRQDGGRLIGQIKGMVHKAKGDGTLQTVHLNINVASLPVGEDDFTCTGEGQ